MHICPIDDGAPVLRQMVPCDVTLVLNSARALQRAAASGGSQGLLQGKKLGLLCQTDIDGDKEGDSGSDAQSNADAAAFRRAASELGAHVAHVRPSLTEASTAEEVQHTARMLGRLYDAVECQGMAADLVRRMSVDAGVPFYDGLACCKHPTARLAELLDGDASISDKRRFVLQAVLMNTL